MQIFADTSFIIALLNPSDDSHQQARAILEKQSSFSLYIDQVIKAETFHVTSLKYGQKDICNLLHWLKETSIQSIDVGQHIWLKAVEFFRDLETKSSANIFDCIHFACMREYGIQHVLTFDKHFADAGFKIVD